MMDVNEAAKALLALLAIVDPIGAIPTFLAVTEGCDRAGRRHVAAVAALTVGFLFAGAAFAGDAILQWFGVSMSAFRVAGGVMLFFMAIEMLHGDSNDRRKRDGEDEVSARQRNIQVAVVPLSLPLLAGPGALSTIVVYAGQHPRALDRAPLVLVAAAVGLVVWLTLRAAARIARRLGQTGILVFTRVMGIFLAAIAVEFITSGLVELMPGLAGGLVQ